MDRNKQVETHRFQMAVAIGVPLVAGVAVRLVVAGNDPLWIDELHTAWVVEGTLGEVADRAAAGNQSPLYFWIAWGICQLGGLNAWALRWPSLVCGVLAMLGGMLWVRRLTSDPVAIGLTGALVACDPGLIFYSTEARPFAMLQLLGLIHVILIAEGWKRTRHGSPSARDPVDPNPAAAHGTEGSIASGRGAHRDRETGPASLPLGVGVSSDRDRAGKDDPTPTPGAVGGQTGEWRIAIGRALTTAAIPWTHLTGGALLVAELLYGVFRFRSFLRSRLWLPLAVGLAASLPLLGLSRRIALRRSDWESISNVQNLLTGAWTTWFVMGAVPLVFAGMVASVRRYRGLNPWVPTQAMKRKADRCGDEAGPSNPVTVKHRLPIGLVLTWGLVPPLVLVALAASGWAPVALARYAQVAALAWPVLAGLAIGSMHPARTRMVAAFVVLALTVLWNPLCRSIVEEHRLPRFRNEDWKEAVAKINADRETFRAANPEREQVPVFLFSNLVEDHRMADGGGERNESAGLAIAESDYLAFPVQGVYRLQGAAVRPRPTRHTPRFLVADIKALDRANVAWLLIRGNETLVQAIVDDLLRCQAAYQAEIRITTKTLMAKSPIHVVRITVETPDSN